jgi:hypothetical protein
MKDKTDWKKEFRILTVGLIILCFLSLWLGYQSGKRIEINIPNSNMINDYCKSKGFDNGWLSSSSCGINEVQCHKKIMDLDEYKCIKWSKNDAP